MRYLLIFILLIGCGPKYPFKLMTNEEIIRETKRCEDVGLKAVLLRDGNRCCSNATYVECRPKGSIDLDM